MAVSTPPSWTPLFQIAGAVVTQIPMASWERLARPLFLFSLFLLAFAGIPLTSGFTAKFAVFAAAVGHAGAAGAVLAVIGVLCSAITAFVYFRIVVLMFFSERTDDSVVVLSPSVATSAAIALGVVVTVLLGVFPSPLLSFAADSALFLR